MLYSQILAIQPDLKEKWEKEHIISMDRARASREIRAEQKAKDEAYLAWKSKQPT